MPGKFVDNVYYPQGFVPCMRQSVSCSLKETEERFKQTKFIPLTAPLLETGAGHAREGAT